jgi:hypothetical protein
MVMSAVLKGACHWMDHKNLENREKTGPVCLRVGEGEMECTRDECMAI